MATIKRITGEIIGEGETILEIAEKNRANLAGANLAGANLAGANLGGANLVRADLVGANLGWADLAWANLAGANLAGANLTCADLTDAALTGAKIDDLSFLFQIPQEGEIIGWGKKAGKLVKLRVPPNAKRTGNLRNRKCRAEWVEVLVVEGAESVTVNNKWGETMAEQLARLLEWMKAVDDLLYEKTGSAADSEFLAFRDAMLGPRAKKEAPCKS